MTIKSESDEWWTTDELYNTLCEENKIHPGIDAAASYENKKCMYYFNDALNIDWLIRSMAGDILDIWLNPPLGKGNTKLFISKAYEQWEKHGMGILCIVPTGVIGRKYFNPMWKNFKAGEGINIEPILPRPKFLWKGIPQKDTAKHDYITVHFKRSIK